MITKPITKLARGERYAETVFGDGHDETYTLSSIEPSTLPGFVRVVYRDDEGTQIRMNTSDQTHVFPVPYVNVDRHGNAVALEGCDRCACGCKYWEYDRCTDCGTHVSEAPRED